MKTVITLAALAFLAGSAFAGTKKVPCFEYHGNWQNSPTQSCFVADGGGSGKGKIVDHKEHNTY